MTTHWNEVDIPAEYEDTHDIIWTALERVQATLPLDADSEDARELLGELLKPHLDEHALDSADFTMLAANRWTSVTADDIILRIMEDDTERSRNAYEDREIDRWLDNRW